MGVDVGNCNHTCGISFWIFPDVGPDVFVLDPDFGIAGGFYG